MAQEINFYQRSMHEANQDRLTILEKGQSKLREDLAAFKGEIKATTRWVGFYLGILQIILEYLLHHK